MPHAATGSRTRVGAVLAVAVVPGLPQLAACATRRAALTAVPAASPSGSSRYFSCVTYGTDQSYCRRLIDEMARRPDVPQAQQDRLGGTVRTVEYAAAWPGFCAAIGPRIPMPSPSVPPSPGGARSSTDCAGWTRPGHDGTEPPDPTDAAAIARSLDESGFPGAVVRLARPDDPAPHASVIYAVPVEDVCVLGHLETLRGGGGSTLLGRRADGTRLAH